MKCFERNIEHGQLYKKENGQFKRIVILEDNCRLPGWIDLFIARNHRPSPIGQLHSIEFEGSVLFGFTCFITELRSLVVVMFMEGDAVVLSRSKEALLNIAITFYWTREGNKDE